MTPLVLFFKSLTGPVTSDFLVQILNQFSEAILLAVDGNRDRRWSVSYALRLLAKLESRPPRLTEIAYEWCSAIYANCEKFEDSENLLLDCLELGFRHLDPSERSFPFMLTHTEHHRGLVDVVFKSQKSEAIADFLRALTANDYLPEEADELVGICTEHLVDCHKLDPFSPRLRQLIIRFVETVGYEGFESAGVEKLIEFLNHLHVKIEEMGLQPNWLSLLLAVIRSSEGLQRLSDWYWECLVEIVVFGWIPKFGDGEALKIAKSLIDAEEWGKLECWIGIVWIYSGLGKIPEEDREPLTLLLFRHRPGAAQRLEQRMERWCYLCDEDVPESLQHILTRAHEAAQQQVSP